MTWDYPIHPAAELLPMMDEAALRELADDIAENGLIEPIKLWKDNTKSDDGQMYLLDGRNRWAAMQLLGYSDPSMAPKGAEGDYSQVQVLAAKKEHFSGMSGASGRVMMDWINPTTYALSKNVKRRHLNGEQKKQAIAAFIDADPTASDRKIGRELGVDGKTVASVRQNAEIPQTAHSPRDRARAVLLKNPDVSVREGAALAGVGSTTVNNVRREMIEAGEIQAPTRGGKGKPNLTLVPKDDEEPKPPKQTAEQKAAAKKAAKATDDVSAVAVSVRRISEDAGNLCKDIGTVMKDQLNDEQLKALRLLRIEGIEALRKGIEALNTIPLSEGITREHTQ